jgi:hypothetical protein
VEKVPNPKVQAAIRDMECSKGFSCCIEGLEKLCKARDIGMKSFIQCLDENGFVCSFSVLFGYGRYCACPLRVYIAKKLKK